MNNKTISVQPEQKTFDLCDLEAKLFSISVNIRTKRQVGVKWNEYKRLRGWERSFNDPGKK